MANNIRKRPIQSMTDENNNATKEYSGALQPEGHLDAVFNCDEVTLLCSDGNQDGRHLSLDHERIMEISIDEAIGTYNTPPLEVDTRYYSSFSRMQSCFKPTTGSLVFSLAALNCANSNYDALDESERIGVGRFQMQIMVAAGLCFASDAMEILLLSFLSVVLLVEWDLTIHQASSITASVFAGAFIGTLTLGRLGDNFGRKPIFILTASVIALFGVGTAFVTSYTGLVLCRFLIGFAVGGIVVPFDILAEFMPTLSRGRWLVTTSYFWTTATLMVPILAYATLGRSKATSSSRADTDQDIEAEADRNWRLFVAICAIPCTISAAVGVYTVPESPRWLLQKGKPSRALKVLRHAAATNNRDPFQIFPAGTQLQGLLVTEDTTFCDLLSSEWLRTTLTLWCLWGFYAFLYYGTIIAVSLVFSNVSDTQDSAASNNNQRYQFDYLGLIVSSSAEIAGVTLVLFTVDLFGRINCMSVYFFLGGLFILLLCVMKESHPSLPDHEDRIVLITLAFLSRLFVYSGSSIVWITTAELLPTRIRATGHSVANAFARIGAFLAPIAVSPKESPVRIGTTMFVVSLVVVVCTRLLPETSGQPLGILRSTRERGQRRRVSVEDGD